MAELDNILHTVKAGLDIQDTETVFDDILLTNINSVMMILHQMGIGPTPVYQLSDGASETWSAFLPDGDDAYLALVKTYMIKKVQMLFDPPTSGIVTNATEALLTEFETRLVTQVSIEDPPAV